MIGSKINVPLLMTLCIGAANSSASSSGLLTSRVVHARICVSSLIPPQVLLISQILLLFLNASFRSKAQTVLLFALRIFNFSSFHIWSYGEQLSRPVPVAEGGVRGARKHSSSQTRKTIALYIFLPFRWSTVFSVYQSLYCVLLYSFSHSCSTSAIARCARRSPHERTTGRRPSRGSSAMSRATSASSTPDALWLTGASNFQSVISRAIGL